MKKRLLVSVIPAVASLALAAPALATTQAAASENWAGYVVTPNDASGFSAVSGKWIAPRVACTANSEPSYSAYWVGLGGGAQQSSALEQIGTQADCSASGTARYYAWYELVPSAPVRVPLAIHPGDSVWARTAVNGDRVSLRIVDQTTHRSFRRTLRMTAATPDTSTAEWVAEAPSTCAGGATGQCNPLPLADFGTASFSDAHATAGGHTGTISDSHWTAQAVELTPSSGATFGGGPGGYFPGASAYAVESGYTGATGAAPTALSDRGTKFAVRYGAAFQAGSVGGGQAASNPAGSGSSSTGGSGNGNGDGYGYGYGYYGTGSGYGDGYGYGGYYSYYGYYGGYGAGGYYSVYGAGY